MKLAHIVPSLEERHGGPTKSVRSLADAAAALGTETDLLSTLAPGHTAAVAPSGAARRHVFPRERPQWLCPSTGLRAQIATGGYTHLHSHGLWLRTLHYAHEVAVAQQIPLVISPRGMMSGWAYEHRRWRKRIAETLIHPGAFAAARGWHATSREEADDIRARGFRQPICVSPNGVELPSAEELAASRHAWRHLCPAIEGRRVAVFYSRFHRKKRVRELVDSWLAQPRGDWFLLLVGLTEEYTAAQINGWIASAHGRESAAAFDGATTPAPWGVASLFLLPSHSENFGLVIAEALAARVPALVTEGCPWPDLPREWAGWQVPWSDWGPALAAALACSPTELANRGAAGAAWMARDFTWSAAARRLHDFYRSLSNA